MKHIKDIHLKEKVTHIVFLVRVFYKKSEYDYAREILLNYEMKDSWFQYLDEKDKNMCEFLLKGDW